MKGVLPESEGRKTLLASEVGNSERREAYTNQPCYFLNLLPQKPKLCLDSSPIKHPKPVSLSCQFLPNVLFLYLGSMKASSSATP